LLHFLVLGALIFALDHVYSATRKEQIIVDGQTIAYLVQQKEDLLLRPLTPEERRQLIETYIGDEIFYREAYKQGLDREDSRMRRNMILKMRGLLVGDLAEPSEQELRAYFEAHRDRFARPAMVALDHVLVADPSQAPDDLLRRLRAGIDAEDLAGASTDLRVSSERVPVPLLRGLLGADLARAALQLEDARWHGPFSSNRGVHYLRISERRPPRPVAYEDVAFNLSGQWAIAQSQAVIEEATRRLRQDYDVRVDQVLETPR
jgi:parvulin-like peptidyl-prolyl isomerase